MKSQSQSIKDRLTRESSSRFANIPRVRPVMQMMLRSNASSDIARTTAIKTVLDWANSKWAGLIPKSAWKQEDFAHDQPGLKLTAVNLEAQGIWGFSVEHLDAQPGYSRTWVTEAIVAPLDREDVFAVRNQCSTTTTMDVPATTPRFVRNWVDRHALVDGNWPVQSKPVRIETTDAVKALVTHLRNPERQLPVLVISEFNDGRGFVFDPSLLAKKVAALAHIVLLPDSVSFDLINRLGKKWAVYNGAVRTYLPGFGQVEDSQFHANILAERILEWEMDSETGEEAFEKHLTEQFHQFSVSTAIKVNQHIDLAALKIKKADQIWTRRTAEFETKRLEIERLAQGDLRDNVELLQLDIEEKNAAIEHAKKLLEEGTSKVRDIEQLLQLADLELATSKEEIESLRAQNSNLFNALKQSRKSVQSPKFPSSYEGLGAWIDEQFADRILLLSRAKRSLKTAIFEEIDLICNCIKMLADEYWELRSATPESYSKAKGAYEGRLKELGVTDAASISPSRLGEEKEQYTVSYSIGQTTNQVLDRHIRGGTDTKDDRYCMRIYFFWDELRQLVVIGNLPGHLNTRAT